jgi:hypothetical protein
MRWGCVVLVVLGTAAPAAANPRREGLTGGFAAGGGAFHGTDGWSGAAGGSARFGFLFAESARFAAVVQVDGFERWHAGTHAVAGSLTGGVATWIGERASVSLTLGLSADDAGNGTTGDSETVLSGFAVTANLGYDVHQWRRSALVAKIGMVGGQYQSGAGSAFLLTLAIDGFELKL